jgi:hypothetical protein
LLNNTKELEKVFYKLHFIYPDDSSDVKAFFIQIFTQLVELLSRPFEKDHFDFSDSSYFNSLYAFGEKLSNLKELRESKKARGVKDALYINRTYFGLYNILHDMKTHVQVNPVTAPGKS